MSEPKWNLQALRNHVRTLGHDDLAPLPRAIRSISQMTLVFSFHAYGAKEALEGFVKEGEPWTEEQLNSILGVGERQTEFAHARLASEAHLLSTLLATRSVYDIFSQVVNELLLSPKLDERDCNIGKVVKRLPAGRLHAQLNKLLTSDWYKYVNGFVNLSKHRFMIEHGVQASFEENTMAIKVGAFEYDTDKWAAKSAKEVLEGAFEVKNKVVECGRALNAACGIAE
jgi:hypothetical protein